jgi:two-component system sensor histidine kinase UhpB
MIAKSKEQIKYAINEIRKLSNSLVPHAIESGGVIEGIRRAVETIEFSTEIKCRTSLSDTALQKLEIKEQLAVYRIVQEQLNNILKHAGAGNICITLSEQDNRVQLRIEDDGKGFDPKSKRAGIGLSNIKSRAEILNGEMKIESAEGEGCKLTVEFPINIR